RPAKHGRGCAATFAGHPAAPPGRIACGDRPSAAPSAAANDDDLCQGGFDFTANYDRALAGRCAMKPLREAVQDYLTFRRAIGFKLRAHQDSLVEFVDFLDQRGVTTITTGIALEWALSKPSTRPGFAADRLRRIRAFARYQLANDPATEIPPVDLLPSHRRRRPPTLYSDD